MSEPEAEASQTTHVTTRSAPEVVQETALVEREGGSNVALAVVSSVGGTAGASVTAVGLNAIGLTGASFWAAFAGVMAVAISIVIALLRRARE